MKLLASTSKTQGQEPRDFCWVKEGELVGFGLLKGKGCFTEKMNGSCGCSRSLVGLHSRKSTTTFKVVDKNINRDEFVNMLLTSNKKAGFDSKTNRKVIFERYEKDADDIIAAVKDYPVGSVLSLKNHELVLRT